MNRLSGLCRLDVLLHPRLLCPSNTVTSCCSDQLASTTGTRRFVAKSLVDKHLPCKTFSEETHGAYPLISQYRPYWAGNPLAGLRMMAERAQDNLRRYKARQPLLGHLLPYLKAEEAQQQGLNFREEHGWIEEE